MYLICKRLCLLTSKKELLLLQMEHEKLKQRSEGSKLELEKTRLEVEALKFKIAKEGKLSNYGEEQGMSFSLIQM